MARQKIDGGPRWFSTSKARSFEEATRWNGNNHISCATGSQWDHQALYLTRKGVWVLHRWSQWQGSTDTWTEVTPEEARDWLLCQDEQDAAEELFPGCVEAVES